MVWLLILRRRCELVSAIGTVADSGLYTLVWRTTYVVLYLISQPCITPLPRDRALNVSTIAELALW